MPQTPLTHKLQIFGKKLTAVAFIFLILIGNIWVIYRFTGETLPPWTTDFFAGGVFFVFVGFLLMVPGWINPSGLIAENPEDSGNDKPES
jgi:hypothetical protein